MVAMFKIRIILVSNLSNWNTDIYIYRFCLQALIQLEIVSRKSEEQVLDFLINWILTF